jgi:hypothetical protein
VRLHPYGPEEYCAVPNLPPPANEPIEQHLENWAAAQQSRDVVQGLGNAIKLARIVLTIYAIGSVIAGTAIAMTTVDGGYMEESHPYVWWGIGLGLTMFASAVFMLAVVAYIEWRLNDSPQPSPST